VIVSLIPPNRLKTNLQNKTTLMHPGERCLLLDSTAL